MATDQSLTAGSRALKEQMQHLSPLMDELNKRLISAEAYFRSLPFKRAVYVPGDEHEIRFFGFDRYRGDWALVVGYYDEKNDNIECGSNLEAMSLGERIQLAELLPSLLEMLRQAHKDTANSLIASLNTLRELDLQPPQSSEIDHEDIPF